jgi:diguanylate cyclase (GGDEF)-like protein/PAS domain S-box-containing protein
VSDGDVQHAVAADVLDHLEEGPVSAGMDYYRAVFDALKEGLCVVEMISGDDEPADYRFVEVNAAFEAATGLRDVAGATFRELMPRVSILAPESYARIARTGTPERFVADSEAPEGPQRFDVYAFRLGDDDSRRVAVHFTDVTQRALTEDELLHRSEQFSSLVAQAPIGVFLVDGAFRLVHVNPVAEAVFGDIPNLLHRDFEEVMRLVWREGSVEDVILAFRRTLASGASNAQADLAAMPSARGEGGYYDWRIDRLLLPDGQYGVVCYFSDVSSQVEARTALAASDGHYRAVFEEMDQGFCVVQVRFDEADQPLGFQYVETNGVFARQTGMSEALGRTSAELEPDAHAFWLELYATIARTGVSKRFLDYVEAAGRWFDVSAMRIGEPHERKVAILSHDVTERKQAEEALQQILLQLRHRSHHDHLTGLPNRLLFEERLQLSVAEAARYRRRLAVLFLDLDGFKEINDRHGHACGDVVLKTIAKRLQDALRTSDTLARMHGDEFVVLLPDIGDHGGVASLAGTLLAEVIRPIDLEDAAMSVTASIGVSLYPRNARHPRGLLHTADAAMYQAKAAGRNTVRFFGSLVPAALADERVGSGAASGAANGAAYGAAKRRCRRQLEPEPPAGVTA